jgi:hypothetical protein
MVLAGAQTQFAQGITEGVYCSDNGGSAWSKILPDQMSTFVGFASSTIAYAALGNPFGSSPNAPNGNGIFKATSIGAICSTVNFTRLTSTNLPLQSSIGRIDLGIAPSDTTGNTVYASIADASTASETNLGVFVTTNGGTSWTQTSAPDICKYQCWYDNVIKVDPNNKNIAYLGGSAGADTSENPNWVIRTADGGNSWSTVIPNARGPGLPHVDNHAIAFFKSTTGTFSGKVRMYLGNDGGVWRTDDAEAATVSWTNLNDSTLTLTQFYPSISINPSSPTIAFGGTQDNGSQNYAGSPNWTDIDVCGDGTGTAIDNLIPSSVYVACNGIFLFSSHQNGAVGTFSPAVNGIHRADVSNFVPPLTADPNAANTLYVGTTKVYQSVDSANTWAPISNDLVGGPDSLVALAVAPGAPNVVYAGATNGEIFVATDVSAGNFANFNLLFGGSVLPPRAVTAIAVDPADKTGNSAYVAFSGFSFVFTSPNFSINDPTGHLFKTTNGGATWTDVSCSVVSPANCTAPVATDLPNIPVNDVVVDPDLPGTIYAATDLGVFVGACAPTSCSWSTLSTGLPRVAVLSLRLHEASRTLRAATHGRGAWDINLNNFSFTGPHISSISPTLVMAGTTNPLSLTVNGSGLAGGAVQWNGSATNVTTTQVSATQLIASVAALLLASAGTPQITVLNGGQTSNALTFAVLATTPTLTSLNPASTPVQTPVPTARVPIQLTGSNFSSTAKVLFNGAQNGITTNFNSSTSLTATLPAALLGPFGGTDDISVLNTPPGGGKSQTVPFKVAAPPPANDNFANATNIITLVFNDVQDSAGASTETADPTPPCVHQFASNLNTGGHPNGLYNTIWYKFTPIFSANLNVDTIGSSYDSVLSIWTGTGTTEATLTATNVACNDELQQGLASIPLTANTPYYIMVSSSGPPDPNPIALGGRTQLNFSYNNGQNGPPDFSITSSGTTTLTVAAGQTATFTNVITVAPQSGFSAQVNLVCSLPAAATATTCSVNPPSFPSGSGTASVMVTTMSRGFLPPLWPRLRFIYRPQFLPLLLLMILISALLLPLARTRGQRYAGALPLAGLALFLLLQTIGCGGGGYTSPPPPPTGTPAGTYTVTVTATSGTLTHAATLTVTVQ